MGHVTTIQYLQGQEKKKNVCPLFFKSRHLLIFSLRWKNVMVFRSHLSWIQIKSKRLRCKLVSYVSFSFPYLRHWARYLWLPTRIAKSFFFFNCRTVTEIWIYGASFQWILTTYFPVSVWNRYFHPLKT